MAKVAKVRTRERGKTFSYIFEAGKVDGKRKVVEKGGFPNRSAAYKAGLLAYADFLHGNIGIVSESVTLKDFMTKWLDEVVAANVKANTLQKYQSRFKNHIAPYLGEVKIQELTPAMLDNWLRKLLQKGLAKNTISAMHAFIHNALNYAVYPAQLIRSNPAEYIKAPKNAPRNVIKRHIITPERFAALLKKYPFGTPFYIPLMLLYHTGMRISEVLGLSWQDIDFAKKRINVRRQIVYISKRGYFFTTLKTESSNRYILIDDCLCKELKRWQARQAENENTLGGRYAYVYFEEDGHLVVQSKVEPLNDLTKATLVCTQNDGQRVLKSALTRMLNKEGLNAHSFRHTHTTQLVESGAPTKAIAGRLGHSNTQITQNLYAHNTLKLQEELAVIFAQTLQTNV